MAKIVRQHVTCVVGHHFVRAMGDYRTACPYCRITVLEKEVEELEKEVNQLKAQLKEIMT